MMEAVANHYSDYTTVLQALYNKDHVTNVTAIEAAAKIDQLYHEKNNLLMEVEGLQRSVSTDPMGDIHVINDCIG